MLHFEVTLFCTSVTNDQTMAEVERPSSPSPLSPRILPATVQLDFTTFEHNLLGKCRKELAWPSRDVAVVEVPKKPRCETSNKVRNYLLVLTNRHSQALPVPVSNMASKFLNKVPGKSTCTARVEIRNYPALHSMLSTP